MQVFVFGAAHDGLRYPACCSRNVSVAGTVGELTLGAGCDPPRHDAAFVTAARARPGRVLDKPQSYDAMEMSGLGPQIRAAYVWFPLLASVIANFYMEFYAIAEFYTTAMIFRPEYTVMLCTLGPATTVSGFHSTLATVICDNLASTLDADSDGCDLFASRYSCLAG